MSTADRIPPVRAASAAAESTASYYTIRELEQRLRCGEQYLRREIHRGALRAVRIGARLLVSADALEEWLASRRVISPDPRRDPHRREREARRLLAARDSARQRSRLPPIGEREAP